MPAGIARVELVFEMNGYGWTEQYYITDATSTLSIATARSLILLEKRRQIMGEQAFITFRSISDTGGQRAGNTYPVPESAGQGTYANTAKEADALLFRRLDGSGKFKSNVFLRAAPQGVIVDGGLYAPGPLFNGDLGAYQTELITGGWGWLGIDTAASKKANIVSIVADAQNRPVFTIDAAVLPIGPPLPKLAFRVSGVQGSGNMNNSWVGQVQTATTIRTLKPVPILAVTPNTGRLSFRVLKFIQIAVSGVQRVVTRHAGRPLYHSAGRQRAQARG